MLARQVIALISGYLLGSIPCGYLLVKCTTGADVRAVGSGSTGATNVGRVAGKTGAMATGILDVGKGMVAVAVAGWLTGHCLPWMSATGVMAVIGHVFPVWLRFRGGKGVATGAGSYLMLSPLAVASSLGVWSVVVGLKRYVSLGSIMAAASLPMWVWLWEKKVFERTESEFVPLIVMASVAGVIVIAKHHENIRRLLAGTESKVGRSKTAERTEEG